MTTSQSLILDDKFIDNKGRSITMSITKNKKKLNWHFTFSEDVNNMTFSMCGDCLYCAHGNKVSMFYTSNGKKKWTQDFGKKINTLSISPYNDFLLVGDNTNVLTMFDVNNHDVVWSYRFDDIITTTFFNPSATLVAFGGQCKYVFILDANTGEFVDSLCTESYFNTAKFSTDGNHLEICDLNQHIKKLKI